jgi:hypothetical protein
MSSQPATVTLFTWGYFGWGNATAQLVAAVDAVEQARGFAPPLFVDTRIQRSVRAKGFNGNAFGKLLGDARHRWMKSLGNKHIETRTGPAIQIAEPVAAAELLTLALRAAERRQRVLFFCGCQYPRESGKTVCHRDAITTLVLGVARACRQPVEVIEWPGGEPEAVEVETTPESLKAVQRGRTTLPLPDAPPRLAGLPWGSAVNVRAGDRALPVVSGPAVFQRGQWALPVFHKFAAGDQAALRRAAAEFRQDHGLDGRRV